MRYVSSDEMVDLKCSDLCVRVCVCEMSDLMWFSTIATCIMWIDLCHSEAPAFYFPPLPTTFLCVPALPCCVCCAVLCCPVL